MSSNALLAEVRPVALPLRRTAVDDNSTLSYSELQPLLTALFRLRDGNFNARLDVAPESPLVAIASVFNQIVDRNQHMADELARVRREVTRHGRLDERMAASPGNGKWATNIEAANALIDALVGPITSATRVLDAVATGDLSQRIVPEEEVLTARGGLRQLSKAVNRMVDQLALFTGEVTRVAREVGTEGRLGGQAQMRGVSGVWKDLTDNVNLMASNLTIQVRDIAQVATAVAQVPGRAGRPARDRWSARRRRR
ncbi:MAG TPA: HAMP domain-containing protein [Actinocrinis sp.]|jgi:methyl-accepting chemotaxis protein